MNKFEEISTFVRVAELGSVSRAAESLNVAKSAISRRISDLEARLDVQLFHRTTRKINLTDSGESFFKQSVQLLNDLAEAEQAVSQASTTLSGPLRVAMPLTFGVMHLSPVINEFALAHPNLQFELDFNDRQIDILEERFDVAIRIAKLEDSSLIARRFTSIQTAFCASPAYLKKFGEPKHPSELVQHQGIIYSNSANLQHWPYTELNGKERKVKVPVKMMANNGSFMREAAIAGHGVVLLPLFEVYGDIENGNLIPILSEFKPPSIGAYAIYPPTRHLSQRVRSFVDFLVERFAGKPCWESCMNACQV